MQRSFFGSHPLTRGTLHALKVAAGTLSAGAATISILTFAKATGLWSRSPDSVPAQLAAVAWMGILPQTDTARAIGDTIQLTATLKDEHGALMTGSPSWSSDDPLVASVDSGGVVVARGEGSTTIVAAAGGRIARSRIAVHPIVSAIEIHFDSSFRVPEGEHRPAVASPVDARGHPLAGLTPLWRSSDSAVARVDSAGIVTGMVPGRAVLEAALGDITARIEVAVIPMAGAASILAGRGQHASAGRPLPQPVVVQVLSRGGRPMDGVPVRFAAEETVLTDATGRARYSWSLSDRPGQQHLAIAVAGLDSALTVSGEADPIASNTRLQLASPLGAAAVGDTLGDRVTINVTDSLGGPLPDIPVAWLALDGGKAAGSNLRTDSLGQAGATWVLGPKAGTQRLRAQVGDPHGGPTLTLKASAEPGAPAGLSVASGEGQSGSVGSALKQAVVVRVADRYGNRIRGKELVLRPEAGTVPDSSLSTDSTGQASLRWTLGTAAGTQRLHVRVSEPEKELIVTAKAQPGKPAALAYAAPPAQGTAGRVLTQPLRVVLKDGYGNPLSNLTVQFAPATGKVSSAQVRTDAHGVATTQWTLGSKPGTQSLSAAVKGTSVRASLRVKAIKAPPAP